MSGEDVDSQDFYDESKIDPRHLEAAQRRMSGFIKKLRQSKPGSQAEVVRGMIDNKPPLRLICLGASAYTESGVLTRHALEALQADAHEPLHPVRGGNTKDAFRSSAEVFLIARDTRSDPVLAQQFQEQYLFYARNHHLTAFRDVVVPITSVITQKLSDGGEIAIGMGQPFFGVSVSEFQNMGGQLTSREIEDFCAKYKVLIREIGIAHGDLVYSEFASGGFSVNWDAVRIDPKTHKILLIDYNGRCASIAQGSHIVNMAKNPETYAFLRENDPKLLKMALLGFFNIKEAPKIRPMALSRLSSAFSKGRA